MQSRYFRRKKAVLRGYQILKQQGQLSKVSLLKNELTDFEFQKIKEQSSACIFGAGLQQAELIVRQFLLSRVAGIKFNESLLLALARPGSKVVHAFPPEWRPVIEKYGFSTSRFRSQVLWNLFLFQMFFYGLAFTIILIFRSVRDSLKSNPAKPREKFVYFDSLTGTNLPSGQARSYDIISWYLQWAGREPGLDAICHNVSGHPEVTLSGVSLRFMNQIPSLDLNKLINFIFWFMSSSIRAVIDLCRGRWWHILMFYEASKASGMRLQDSKNVATDYLFNNSSWILKPLWTYEAEKLGSHITLYFYSTNCETFKTESGYPIQANSWQVMNWKRYIVWNEYQADFVRRAVGNEVEIFMGGCIWFQSRAENPVDISSASIAVFDVQPYRDSHYQLLVDSHEYYVMDTSRAFLSDIAQALEEANYKMMFKRKREIGKLGIRAYGSLLNSLEEKYNFTSVNSNISPQLLIEKCEAVISMPFTSTALIGRDMGKPSAFYDPHGKVQKDDRAAHGIDILTGPEELKLWLKGIKKKPTFEP